jgi:IclR family acetate operon transcriptional repressor
MQLLRLMLNTSRKEWGVRELARAAGMASSTVHRLLTSLEQEGLVQNVGGSGRYQLGLELHRIAQLAQAQFQMPDIALPFIQNLVAECNETVFLGLFDPMRMEVMFTAVVESSHQLRYVINLNEWIPIHAGATGLSILAFLPQEERERVYEQTKLFPITQNTITDPVVLEETLARFRSQGYAFTWGQRIPGAVGLGAPIWDSSNKVVGNVLITIPEQRFEPNHEANLARVLLKCTQSISERLSGKMTEEIQIKE